MSFTMKTGFCLLLAGCLCLGVGCASVKPAPAPRVSVVVPAAPDSALVRTVKDWWHAPPPDVRPAGKNEGMGACLLGNVLVAVGTLLCR